jgi:uncharacterized membrane protein (DUF441 family)
MTWDSLPLLIILVLSVLGNNQSVAIAAGFLLLVKLLDLHALYPVLESKGMNAGIIILTIAILTPLATGRISLNSMLTVLRAPTGIIALTAGIFVAWAAGRGLTLITASPEMISSLVLGTVVGVCFLQGVAIGPLVAGGLVSLVVALLSIFK